MPTPFMHMALAERLISDPQLGNEHRELIRSAWGAFLLGSIAPDARVSSGIRRGNTHFFEYERTITPPPAVAMLNQFPELQFGAVSDATRAVFIAGYAGHLAMDEVWCTDMLFPSFVDVPNWQPQEERHLALHLLLGHLDQRDRATLPDSQYAALSGANPDHWLPFLGDDPLAGWRDLIAVQLAPGGVSQSASILGARVGLSAEILQAHMNDSTYMQRHLWANVDEVSVQAVEQAMYQRTLGTVDGYLSNRLVA